MMADHNKPEGKKLDVIDTLIKAKVVKHFPMDLPDPLDAIKFIM